MYLPRDVIAFRKEYQQLLVKKALTTVFRPGNRIYPYRRGYKPGEVVTARIIEKCGSDKLGIPPLFNEVKMHVCIKDISVVNIDTLKQQDFMGSSPDVFDIQSLEQHLYYIYEKPIDDFDRQVTTITLDYEVEVRSERLDSSSLIY